MSVNRWDVLDVAMILVSGLVIALAVRTPGGWPAVLLSTGTIAVAAGSLLVRHRRRA